MSYQILNYYEILEISRNATPEEIKKTRDKLILRWHPDKFGQPGHLAKTKEEAEEKTQQINAAYEVLSNSEKRKQFDSLVNNRDNELDFPIKVMVTIGALTLILYLISKEEDKRK